MNFEWKRFSKEETYLLFVDKVAKAAVWFLGGHVERPDAWHITCPNDNTLNDISFQTLDDAKVFLEEHYVIEQKENNNT